MTRQMEWGRRKNLYLAGVAICFAIIFGIFAEGNAISVFAAGKGTVTAANGAKVRKEASTSSEMVASAAKDTTVSITSSVTGSDGNTWYQVTVDGATGYIRSDLLTVTDSAGITSENGASDSGTTTTTTTTTETPVDVIAVNPVSATVTGGQSVRIRSNASTSSQIVTTASNGLALTVTGTATGSDGKTWYQVTFIADGATVEGFIRSDYVNLSEELTEYTEEPAEPEATEEPEVTEEPAEAAPYSVTEQDGKWYLVITESNEGYVIEDIFTKMQSNLEEYNKLDAQVTRDRIIIIILVILVVGAAGGAAFLFFKMREMRDDAYFGQVEKETLRRREGTRPSNGKVTHRVGPEANGRPAGARPAGARPAGARPAGAGSSGQGRPAGSGSNGARPVGAAGNGQARPAGARPAGSGANGARPTGAGSNGQARPAGARPAGAQGRPSGEGGSGQARPAGAEGGSSRPASTQASRATNAAPRSDAQSVKTSAQKQNQWQSKNFMADDDDEFEFEFLNYDGDEE